MIGLALAEEFTYEILYSNTDTQHALDPTIALQLVRKHRDKHTGTSHSHLQYHLRAIHHYDVSWEQIIQIVKQLF